MKWTPEDFAEQIGNFRREVGGLVRRMVVTISEAGVWQVAGHLLFDGKRETRDVENFPGIGIAARAPSGGSPEAVVVNMGGQNAPAIVALRDEATRGKVADLLADETAAYNSAARVHVKADGTIEARTHAGTAHRLATIEDLQALSDAIHGWAPTPNDGGAALHVVIETLRGTGWPHGTDKLKGE